MAKQIKAYVDVEAYVELSWGRGSDPAVLLSSVLVGEAFGEALAHLAESASGSAAPARIISGPNGAGKSTVLAVLHALAANPQTRSRTTDQHLRTAASYLSGTGIVPVFADLESSDSPDLITVLRVAFGAAASLASAASADPNEWTAASMSDDPVARGSAILPAGWRLVLFVDGLARWASRVEREAARHAIAELVRFGDLAPSGSLSVFVELDERSLDASDGIFLPLLRSYQVEYLPLSAIVQLCDRFLFKKDPHQRVELGALYDDLKRVLPTFRWSREEFVSLYPLHPATIEAVPALTPYAPSFSFLRFAATAGNRAKGRRDLSLVVLDELFDTCEYELRKAPEMSAGFEIFDDFVNGVVPKLADSQQRFWAKLVLKGLFLYSLAGRSASARLLADTMMLYDEADQASGERAARSILDAFEERAVRRFVVEGEGPDRAYLLPVAEEHSGARVLAEIASEIPDGDPRLAALLVGLGRARFRDWPAELGGEPGMARLEIPWRGTMRAGLLAFRSPTSIAEIPPVVDGLPTIDTNQTDIFDDDILGLGFGDQPDEATIATGRLSLSFLPAESICEDDWEIAIMPVAGPVEMRKGPPTLASWIPGEPGEGDLHVLKRLAAIASNDPKLDAPGVDLEALRAEVEAEGGLVFHHLYVERGRFAGPAWEAPAAPYAASETLEGLFSLVLEARLDARYPQHPTFGGEIDEASVRLVTRQFFPGTGLSDQAVQHAAAAFAAPMGLADATDEGGPLRFNPNSDTALMQPFNVEPMRLAEAGGDEGVPLAAVYQTLRREPYGLQQLAQQLVIAARIASGRLELEGPNGALTAARLAETESFDGYTHLRRAGLTVYSNETLLEWVRLVTESDHLNDLVTHDGRLLVRRALEEWLARWRALDLRRRFDEVPPEAATRRTWQLILSSRQFFESTARAVEAIFSEEVALEEGLGRIVTTFAANATIYERAIRDLRMLTSFIEWVPFYTYSKEYVLGADRTAEPRIEAQRAELLDFITSPHRLLDDSKRRRFEGVYETFLQDYVDYYTSAHELHVGSRADFDALDAYLEGTQWRRFELLSEIRVTNAKYYQFASDIIRGIRDVACELPVRELLRDRPSCVCGFRLSSAFSVSRLLDRLRFVEEQGATFHLQAIRNYRQAILSGLRAMQSDEAFANAAGPLIALLSRGDETIELTPSAVDLINRCLKDAPIPVAIASPPQLEPGTTMTKDQLRGRLMQWLEELPGDDGVLIEIGRALPASADE